MIEKAEKLHYSKDNYAAIVLAERLLQNIPNGGNDMKKLIAIDIDGTLYNDEKEITPKTLDALLQVQKKGHIIVLASGRPTAGLVLLAEKLQMEKYHGMICAYNGGLAMDCQTKEVVYSATVPNETARRFLKHLEKYPVNPIVDDGYFIYTNDPNGFQIPYESQSNNLKVQIVETIHEAITFSPAKILVAAPEQCLNENEASIKEPFGEELSFTRSAPVYLEVTPKGVNKAKTLQILCSKLGVAQGDTLAFGDADNDKEMVEFAGIGIAMDNAADSLKAAANIVTASNNEDGIAAALKRLELI